MAEDEGAEGEVTGLGESDIEQNVYEGGFKSWEGATDLALLLLDRGEEYRAGQRQGRDASPRHVVEVCMLCFFGLGHECSVEHLLMLYKS